MAESLRAVQFSTPASDAAASLTALFQTIPDQKLIAALKTYYAGRRGYGDLVLWRTYLAGAYLNVPSFAALRRLLAMSDVVRAACGITDQEHIPSKFAYSRFMAKLKLRLNVARVKDVFRELSRTCYERFPGFGKSVAIDATDMKAFSNGAKRRKADKDAGWAVKPDTHGKLKYVYGYKAHVMVDTVTELPMAVHIAAGNTHDGRRASRVLAEARKITGKFHPDYIIADAGYSSEALRRLIKRQFRAEPVIKNNPEHKRAVRDYPETAEWREVYKRRTAVERLFSRLKGQRRFNSITVRRLPKVTVHCFVPLIVTVALVLTSP